MQSSHLEGAVSLPCLVGQDVEHMEYFVTYVQAKTADERLTDQHKDCFVKKGNCVSLFDSYTQGKFLPWLYLMTISNYFIKVFIYTYKACLIKINSLIRLSWELCLLAPWENGMKFLWNRQIQEIEKWDLSVHVGG